MKKLNQLINNWPRGTVYTSSYLKEKGISNKLVSKYEKSGWVENVGRGAYKLGDDPVEWYGGLFALQKQLGLTAHPGAKTALQLKGYGHFLPERINRVFLFGLSDENLPKWFKQYEWDVSVRYKRTKIFPELSAKLLSDYEYRDFSIKVSSPELAIMEMLYLVPAEQSFSEAYLIMENLNTLRAGMVEEILEKINSVKVKRLFMYMADKHNHPWLKRVNKEKIDLGTGKRVIVKDGRLDSAYKITVPREIEDER